MSTQDNKKYYSLYEYLGRPAGPELGKKVYRTAKILKQPIETKEVKNVSYTGRVICYTKEFLNEYFKKQVDESSTPDEDEYDDLPF